MQQQPAGTADAPAYRLVRPPGSPVAAPTLDAAQQAVVDHRRGPLLVLAGPGTGKTTTLVESVVARVRDGADPESLLVLTFSRKAAAELRERITARLGATTREPLARTFHSYAFGVLRREAAARGEPPPRLLSGTEQDVVVRELLAGGGPGRWPDHVRPALGVRGFAQELRDLLLRAFERGVGPEQLALLGERAARAEWVAAADFMREYAEVTALRDPSAYDPAELIRAVLDLWTADPALLDAERSARSVVLVDELQDTDPAQLDLLTALAGGGADLVAVGDPDQSIYGFRGSDPSAVSGFPGRFRSRDGDPAPTLALATSRRFSPALLGATRRVAERIGTRGVGAAHRDVVVPDSRLLEMGEPPVVAVFRSASQEAAWIAARLREAHLRDRVPWASMAVLVRSTTGAAPVLRRALTSAGVPVAQSPTDLPLAAQPFVKALLLLVRCAMDPAQVDEAVAEELLLSPLGGADVLALRRLRRELRALELAAGGGRVSGDLLAELLRNPVGLAALDQRTARPAHRVIELVGVVRRALAGPGADAETVLWTAWRGTGLAQRWERLSAAGGPAGAAADRDLDATLGLFEAAARFVDRLPGAQIGVFLDALSAQQLAHEALAKPADPHEGVRVLTAHASKGLEWEVVCVAGVQEGTWPDLRVRGSFLGSEHLLELVDGDAAVDSRPLGAGARPTAATVATLSRLLDEERRLFYVACTRARRLLLVSAVTSEREGLQPSRFLDELDPLPTGVDTRPVTVPARAMSLAGVVGALRQVVVTPAAPQALRDAAATRLADLAEARVPGADPRTWWGLAPLSDDRPVRDADEPVPVSPSRVDAFGTCPLRWFLEAAGGGDGPGVRQAVGTAVHAVAEQARAGATDEELLALLRAALRGVDIGRGWVARQETDRAEAMVRRLGAWLRASTREVVGTEVEFAVDVGRARLRGRVDRLERDAQGRAVVVDVKTGSAKAKKAELPRHAQLGTYQVAAEHGAFAGHELHGSGGAELVQVGVKSDASHTVQRQAPIAEDVDPEWATRLVVGAAEGMAAAGFPALVNQYCDRCPVRTSCPLRDEGRTVTGGPP